VFVARSVNSPGQRCAGPAFSPASGKEGGRKKKRKIKNKPTSPTLFTACGREGERAKQRLGESTLRAIFNPIHKKPSFKNNLPALLLKFAV
jgi:hypothetical protein